MTVRGTARAVCPLKASWMTSNPAKPLSEPLKGVVSHRIMIP